MRASSARKRVSEVLFDSCLLCELQLLLVEPAVLPLDTLGRLCLFFDVDDATDGKLAWVPRAQDVEPLVLAFLSLLPFVGRAFLALGLARFCCRLTKRAPPNTVTDATILPTIMTAGFDREKEEAII